MDIKKREKRGSWWLWLLVAVSLAVIGGWKWMEYSSTREAEQGKIFAKLQKEKSALSLKLSLAEKAASENKSEAERLLAEKTLLEVKLADCGKPKPVAKRIVPRVKKTRVVKSKKEEPKAVIAPQEESLAQKLEKACGGRPTKFIDGKWSCVPAPPVAVAEPNTSSFAKAIDEEVGVQAQVPARTSASVAYVAPPSPRCPAYIDSNGMLVPEGYRRVPGGSRVLCN